MDETTTTATAPEETGEEITSQPQNPEQPAEASTTETQPDLNGDEVDNGDEPDDVNLEWLAKTKGVDPNDPKAVAEAWRKAEQEFHKSRQQASTKLKDAATSAVETGNPLADEVRVLQVRQNIRDFNDGLRDQGLSKTEIQAINDEMAAVLEAKPYLDLEATYALVKVGKSEAAIKAAEDKGREAAKAEIARSSAAKSPRGNASAGIPSKTLEEERLERFSKWE